MPTEETFNAKILKVKGYIQTSFLGICRHYIISRTRMGVPESFKLRIKCNYINSEFKGPALVFPCVGYTSQCELTLDYSFNELSNSKGTFWSTSRAYSIWTYVVTADVNATFIKVFVIRDMINQKFWLQQIYSTFRIIGLKIQNCVCGRVFGTKFAGIVLGHVFCCKTQVFSNSILKVIIFEDMCE